MCCGQRYSKLNNAKIGKEAEEAIGADHFVPIFLYVTIHAELPTPFQCCQLMKRFALDAERNSEVSLDWTQIHDLDGDLHHGLLQVGYYLTCLEGALMHVTEGEHASDGAVEPAANGLSQRITGIKAAVSFWATQCAASASQS